MSTCALFFRNGCLEVFFKEAVHKLIAPWSGCQIVVLSSPGGPIESYAQITE